VQDRTAERDHLKKVTPVVDEIHQLRKKVLEKQGAEKSRIS
jgi:hypothetical protein